ncbi:ferredoxin reductase [Marisediminicola sp. LYQ134]|uniref:ferredoxin reductase n=1 Tax=Marisediminicola sp. LYQ134 TaxID=3391061 RepID=UPI0039838A07
MTWSVATVVAARIETDRSRTLTLDVEGWSGHIPGQHVDVRLTAEDGYTAVRSYSIATSALSSLLEITVDRLDDGEVSPYLVDGVEIGDRLEIRGPAGGWFVWRRDQPGPVQLIGGGSGIVPLMAMMRTHADVASSAPFRTLYSVRSPADALFRPEILELERRDPALDVTWAFTRSTPESWPTAPARLDAASLASAVFPPSVGAAVFVCGSTPFVERIATILVDAGHDPALVRTERYGGLT